MLRTFAKFNKKSKCEICGTNKDNPCALLPINDTQKGNICEGAIVHLSCLDLSFDRDTNCIYQKLKQAEEHKDG